MVNRIHERGVAIFIVVMVLTMLSAIGVFAMKAAGMANAASGYERQNTQNHYAAEYGMLGAVTELGTSRRNGYIEKMSSGVDTCAATRGLSYDGGVVPCYHLYASDVQRSVTPPLFAPSTASGTTIDPGSLGPAALTGDFVVEMTDPGPVGVPVAGTDVGGSGSKFKYLQVTLTATGQVRPSSPSTTACDDKSAVVAGNETGRAFVVIGPLP